MNLIQTVLNRGLDWMTASGPFQLKTILWFCELQHLTDLQWIAVGYGHRTSPVLPRTNIVDTRNISQSHSNDFGIKNVFLSHVGEVNDADWLARAESNYFFLRKYRSHLILANLPILDYWHHLHNSNFQIKAILELGTDLILSHFGTGKQTSWILIPGRLAMHAWL